MFIETGYNNRQMWAKEEFEAWIIKDKKTGKVLSPSEKYVFDNENNALKSLYRFFDSKENAQPFLDQFEIVCIGKVS
jgi:hypothetical protein